MKIYGKTPPRLHMGLMDLNVDSADMFGCLGVGAECPNAIVKPECGSKQLGSIH